jgi:hypothetical protein
VTSQRPERYQKGLETDRLNADGDAPAGKVPSESIIDKTIDQENDPFPYTGDQEKEAFPY